MNIATTDTLTEGQKQDVLRLWNAEYPEKLNYATVEAFDAYLGGLSHHTHILLLNGEQVLGWAFCFTRNGARWFAIILAGIVQRRGFGRQLLNELKLREPQLNGWVADHNNDLKANGEPYLSPLHFYLRNGFTLLPESRLELENLSAVQIRWDRPQTIL